MTNLMMTGVGGATSRIMMVVGCSMTKVHVTYNVVRVIGRAKRAPHWGVQSRFCVIYICIIYVYMSVCLVCQINCVGGITWTKHAHAQSLFFWRLNQ